MMTAATLGVGSLGSHEVHWKLIEPNEPLAQFFTIFHDPARHVPANCRFAGFVTKVFEPFAHMPFKRRLVAVIRRWAAIIDQPLNRCPTGSRPEYFLPRRRTGHRFVVCGFGVALGASN